MLQEHAVLTVTPSQPPRCCYQRRPGGPGQRVKPGTPEAKGQVRGLGEKGQKYAFRFPRAPAAQLPSTGSLVNQGTITGAPPAAPSTQRALLGVNPVSSGRSGSAVHVVRGREPASRGLQV